MSDTSKLIVVFGATGQQGVALIEALVAHNTADPTPRFSILALSRDLTTSTSKRLAMLPNVKVVQVAKEYMDDASKTYSDLGLKHDGVYGVFSLQGYVGDEMSYKQGVGIAEAAHKMGVKHLVYASGDTGGLEDTGVSFIEVKRKVAKHIASLTPPTMALTVLRPAQFMENLLPTGSFFFKIVRTVLLHRTFYHHPGRKHQLVSTRDIGKGGAVAFANPEKWMNKDMRMAGDELTMPQLKAIYREVMGKPVDTAPGVLASLIKTIVPAVANQAKFFDDHGYNINIAQTREFIPDLEDFRTFLERNEAARK